MKKIGGKKYRVTVPSFWFPEKQTVLKIFLVDFLNHPELRKRYQKVVGIGRRLQRVAELRKSNFLRSAITVLQLFLIRNSAIDLVVRNIAELRRCGLKLRMPSFDCTYVLQGGEHGTHTYVSFFLISRLVIVYNIFA
jgi:hypothetical protein